MRIPRSRLLGGVGGFIVFVLAQRVIGGAVGHLINRTVARSEVDVVGMALFAAILFVSASAGGIVSMLTNSGPWWLAPGIAGIVEGLLILVSYASHGPPVGFVALLMIDVMAGSLLFPWLRERRGRTP